MPAEHSIEPPHFLQGLVGSERNGVVSSSAQNLRFLSVYQAAACYSQYAFCCCTNPPPPLQSRSSVPSPSAVHFFCFRGILHSHTFTTNVELPLTQHSHPGKLNRSRSSSTKDAETALVAWEWGGAEFGHEIEHTIVLKPETSSVCFHKRHRFRTLRTTVANLVSSNPPRRSPLVPAT